MKTLALHGYTQNSKKFLEKLKNFFSASFRNQLVFICPDAPLILSEESRGWWPLESKEIFIRPHEYSGVELAMETIPPGHYELIVGFSQGAVAAMIALDRGRITTEKMILISPSDIMDPRYTPKVNSTPVLIVSGEKDLLCPPEASRLVRKYYPQSEVRLHSGGHSIPNFKRFFDEIKISVMDLEGKIREIKVDLYSQVYDVVRELIQHKNIWILKNEEKIRPGTIFHDNGLKNGDRIICVRPDKSDD